MLHFYQSEQFGLFDLMSDVSFFRFWSRDDTAGLNLKPQIHSLQVEQPIRTKTSDQEGEALHRTTASNVSIAFLLQLNCVKSSVVGDRSLRNTEVNQLS